MRIQMNTEDSVRQGRTSLPDHFEETRPCGQVPSDKPVAQVATGRRYLP